MYKILEQESRNLGGKVNFYFTFPWVSDLKYNSSCPVRGKHEHIHCMYTINTTTVVTLKYYSLSVPVILFYVAVAYLIYTLILTLHNKLRTE